ncbi:unnamed protein product [Spirodela intermedia]|uniref:Uncharacterized protein n=1 Tax=Spirodela intermedia TaxID=51605 RepID=A0A7I8J1S0_SPIIN|nr:unnamed protein product [Spirodela intermedia]CAA6664009.1 unnamed protein product [Spirodela intermedia]
MKSSLRKLRGIAGHHRVDLKEKKGGGHPRLQLDELARASQDMRDMRNCYDSLLSAAAATANCAYEFSESLGELGSCLLKRTALNDDEDSGRVLLMLGKVQFELQKLVDIYRSHITLTISTPSESLLNELRTVEEMKRQCDGKRLAYEHMLAATREKGRSKNSRESFSHQQLHEAREDYDEEATLFVFRLKSLKQGQSRSLLTQAARHHSAQLNFFRKGIKSLEAIEPHVKMVAEKQHIDYQFSGLEDYETEDENEDDTYNDDTGVEDGSDGTDNGELSFDYGQNEPVHDTILAYKDSEENVVEKGQSDSIYLSRPHPGSQSAPIFPDKKVDPGEGMAYLRRTSTKKFSTYVLPTPIDCNISSKSCSYTSVPLAPLDGNSAWRSQSRHSMPLEPPDLYTKNLRASPPPKATVVNSEPIGRPPPLKESWGHSPAQSGPHYSDAKKLKRQAFSGPLLSQGSGKSSWFPSVQPPVASAAPLHVPRPPSTSPKVSLSASPPPMRPSPKITELHELPRPHLVRHSAPLVSRSRELSMSGKLPPAAQVASPLPMPQGGMARSFSIPSRSQRSSLDAVKLMEAPSSQDAAREVSSPSLMPISFSSPARDNII